MENYHWALPFAVGFNIIKVHSFDAALISMKVDLEMIIVIKFTGCPDQEEVMDWCIENLRCRINEAEDVLVIDNISRPGLWNLLKEGHDYGDYLKGTIRVSETFFCHFADYNSYPFDTPEFYYRF